MNLTEEQRDLRDAVRALLSRKRPAGDGQEPPWPRLCAEIGVAGLAIPEKYGGAGAGPAETHVVAEELGRLLVPSPLIGSAVLAAQVILATGDTAACERLLPAIAGGTATAALAWTTSDGRWDPAEVAFRAVPSPDEGAGAAGAGTGWTLDGTAHYVLDGDRADVLLAAAQTPDGTGLFEVDPRGIGVTRTAVTSMDPAVRLAVIELSGAAGRPVGGPAGAALAHARDLACVALSAEQVGAAQRALELTVAYTKTRVQFGRAIGSFQALQHRLADLYVLAESARALSYAAAAAAADGTPGLAQSAAAAKVYCSEALNRAAAEMIQMHGAIGITWEHDAHRFFKHAHSTAQLFGQPSEHLARVAAELIDR